MEHVSFSSFVMLILIFRIDGTFLETVTYVSVSNHTPDISIKFTNKLQNTKMQLKISADVKEQKYKVRTNDERTFRRVSNGRM